MCSHAPKPASDDRNNRSHGFFDNVGWVPAAALLQAVLHLTMYGPKPSPEGADVG